MPCEVQLDFRITILEATQVPKEQLARSGAP